MYIESVKSFSLTAKSKAEFAGSALFSYLLAAILAGAYIGIGIVLIFAVGAPLAENNSVFLKTLMGVSFGIALTLVVFAGAELFTGNNMFMTIGFLNREVGFSGVLKVWSLSWAGNLFGSLLLAYIVVKSGAVSHAAGFIEKTSVVKMTLPAIQLFLRGLLCNWLVCLALWTSGRTKSDAAKCILIFWCLFAFIACGYEHSVANMTLLAMPLFAENPGSASWWGFGRNLFYVTLGNIAGGGVFVGAIYYFIARKENIEDPGRVP